MGADFYPASNEYLRNVYDSNLFLYLNSCFSFSILLLEFGLIFFAFCGITDYGGSMDISFDQEMGDVTRRVYTRGELYAIRRTMGRPDVVQ